MKSRKCKNHCFYGTSKCSLSQKLLMFKRNCVVPHLLSIYLQRVASVPRDKFPSRNSKTKRQNIFRSDLCCFPCFVLSIYNSLHLARLQISVFLLTSAPHIFVFSLCSKRGAEIAFHPVTKTFDTLTSLLFETIMQEKVPLRSNVGKHITG